MFKQHLARHKNTLAATILSIMTITAAAADEAKVISVSGKQEQGVWRFDVTIDHTDLGWQDYVNKFRIMSPDGTVLGERPIPLPLIEERPFSRSISQIIIPADVSEIIVQAHEKKGGWGPEFSYTPKP